MAKKKEKKETRTQKYDRELREFQKSLEGLTPEEKIAANKARVAKYHSEPDLSYISPAYRRAVSKIEFKKGLKKIWKSIVSVPMGGMNKNNKN